MKKMSKGCSSPSPRQAQSRPTATKGKHSKGPAPMHPGKKK